MRNNTEIFETKENKELDTLIKQYNDLKILIDDYTETKNKVTNRIKELCNKKAGKYETPNFVFALDESNRTKINVVKLAQNHADIWETIPVDVISISTTDIKKKHADIWETIPADVITVTPIISMGTITPRTKV